MPPASLGIGHCNPRGRGLTQPRMFYTRPAARAARAARHACRRAPAGGRGKFKLTSNGKPVLETGGDDLAKVKGETVKLNKGKNHRAAEYQSADAGDAWVRLYWSSSEFPPEPIAPSMYSHNAADKQL